MLPLLDQRDQIGEAEHAGGITKERDRIGKAEHAGGISVPRAPPLILAGQAVCKWEPPPGSWLDDRLCCTKGCATGDHPPGLAG